MRRWRGTSGVTLIEVMVVVAVIALIAAIALPVLSAVRERGDRLTCQTHLRQIWLACKIYADDHRGFWPRAQPDWEWQVYPEYASKAELFDCPACERRFQPDARPHPIHGAFSLNAVAKWSTWPHERRFRDPAGTILALDGLTGWTHVREPIPNAHHLVEEEGVEARHGQGLNVLFLDGHSEWRSLESLTDNHLWTATGG